MIRHHYQRRRGTTTHADLRRQAALAGYRFSCSRWLAAGRALKYPGRGVIRLDSLQ